MITHEARDFGEVFAWLAAGENHFTIQARLVSDTELTRPSLLPGWDKAHVIGHVARNADALINLLDWARTGTPTPMYPQEGARERDIETAAAQSPSALRRELAASQQRLQAALTELPYPAWAARVRSALGRDIPVSEVPWLRVREVWLHAVDLKTGATPADFPSALVDRLLTDVTATLTSRGAPQLLLVPDDRDAVWHLGSSGDGPQVVAPAHVLLAWVTGRGPQPSGTSSVALPRWL
ncbi:maleylpyruvate isomerase family mycothiol-dependent enzyme [Streptomyces sp. NPDC054919]